MAHRFAFTLIDLLIVIAAPVVLVIIVFTLNPAELLREARDSIRIFNMATLNSAIGYSLQYSPSESLGSPNTVYVSIPDPTATTTAGDQCQGLGLPTLPATYTYQCAASSTYRLTNGTGWIPINFSQASLTLLFVLPVDPTNTSSSRHYYTYAAHGHHYEVTSVMESAKNRLGGSGDVVSADSGTMSTLYENASRSRIGLEPLDYSDYSLIGLWTYSYDVMTAFDKGHCSESNATTSSSQTEVGAELISFVENPACAKTSTASAEPITDDSWSLTFWVNTFASSEGATTLVRLDTSGGLSRLDLFGDAATSSLGEYKNTYYTPAQSYFGLGWYFFAEVQHGDTSILYINGSQSSSLGTINAASPTRGSAGSYFSGLIDDVRIYNRALSAAQIMAVYAGGK